MQTPGERVRVYDNGITFTATVLYEDDDRMGNTWIYLHPDDPVPLKDFLNDHGQMLVMKKIVTITPL